MKRALNVILSIILVVAVMVAPFLRGFVLKDASKLLSAKNTAVVNDDNGTVVASDMVYQCDCPVLDFVTLKSEKKITPKNIGKYLDVESYLGDIPKSFSVEETGEGYYRVTPETEMTEGCTYDFSAKNGATFVADGSEKIETVTKRIAKEETEVVELKSGIVYVDWDDVEGTSADTITEIDSDKSETLTDGSVLCIMDGYNEWKNGEGTREELANLYDDETLFVRVQSVEQKENGEGVNVSVVDAEPGDVYDNIDVYIEEQIDADDLIDLDEIEKSLEQSEGTEQMTALLGAAISEDETVNYLLSEDAGSTTYFRNGVSYENGVSVSLGTQMLQGLSVTAVISTDAENANFPNAMEDGWEALELTFAYETQIKTVKIKAEVRVTQYLNISMQGYKDMNGNDLDFDYAMNMYSQTNFDVSVLVCSTEPTSKIVGNVKNQTSESSAEKWFDISESIKEHLSVESSDSDNVIAQMQELLDSNGGYIDLLNIPIVRAQFAVIPILPVFTVGLNLNYVLRINFAAGISSQMTVLDAVQIGMEGSTEGANKGVRSYKNELPGANRYSYDLYAAGYLGVKTGFQGQLTLSFVGLNQLGEIGIEIEVGVYVDCYGYVHFSLTKKSQFSDNVDKQLYGGYYLDLGLYLEINAIAQSQAFDLKAKQNLYEHKWSLASFGDRYVFYGLTSMTSDSQYFMNTNSTDVTKLISLEGKFLDLTTGETEIRDISTVLDKIDLSFSEEAFSYDKSKGVVKVNPNDVRKYTKSSNSNVYISEQVNKTICTVTLTYSGPSLLDSFSSEYGVKKEFKLYWANPITGIQSIEDFNSTYKVQYAVKLDDGSTVILDSVEYVEAGQSVNGFKVTDEEKLKYTFKKTSGIYSQDYNLSDFKATPSEDTVYTINALRRQAYVTFIYFDADEASWVASIRAVNVGDVPQTPETDTDMFASWNNNIGAIKQNSYDLFGLKPNEEVCRFRISSQYESDYKDEIEANVKTAGIELVPRKELREIGYTSMNFALNTTCYKASYRDCTLIVDCVDMNYSQKIPFGNDAMPTRYSSASAAGMVVGWDYDNDGVADADLLGPYPPMTQATMIARAIYANALVDFDFYAYDSTNEDFVKTNELSLYSNYYIDFNDNGIASVPYEYYDSGIVSIFNSKTAESGWWEYSYAPINENESRVWKKCEGRLTIESRDISFRFCPEAPATVTFTTSSQFPFIMLDGSGDEITSYTFDTRKGASMCGPTAAYKQMFYVSTTFNCEGGYYELAGWDKNGDNVVDISQGEWFTIEAGAQTYTAVYTFKPYNFSVTVSSEVELNIPEETFSLVESSVKNGFWTYVFTSDYTTLQSFVEYIKSNLPEGRTDSQTHQQYQYSISETQNYYQGTSYTSYLHIGEEIVTHNITLNANGGKFIYPSESDTARLYWNSGEVRLGEITQYINYSPRKYSDGVEWSVDYWTDQNGNTYTDDDTFILNADMTLTAHWIAYTYIVLKTSDASIGDFDNDDHSTLATWGMFLNVGEHNVSELIQPKQSSNVILDMYIYSVTGWTDEATGKFYSMDDTITITEEPITLVAQWEMKAVRVRFLNAEYSGEEGNNPDIPGDLSDLDYTFIPVGTYQFSDFPKVKPTTRYSSFAKEFDGWKDVNTGTLYKDGDTVVIDSPTTFEAVYIYPDVCMANFHANGGYFEDGSEESDSCVLLKEYTVIDENYTGYAENTFPLVKNHGKADYNFLGWEITRYLEFEPVETVVVAPGETYTISPVSEDTWQKIECTALWEFVRCNEHDIGYAYDDNCHWEICCNEGCGYASNLHEAHRFVNGCCAICGCRQAPKQDKNGNYLISNYNNLLWLGDAVYSGRNTMSAVLTRDIELDNYWVPIGYDADSDSGFIGDTVPFKGTFDGQGHTISYLSTNGYYEYAGFIAILGEGGTICNLNIEYSYVFGESASGIICGMNGTEDENGGLIENCSVNYYNPSGEAAGSICGKAYNGTIRNCVASFPYYGIDEDSVVVPIYYADENVVIENVYYYNPSEELDDISGTSSASLKDILSGKIAYTLSQCINGSAWGQNNTDEVTFNECHPTIGGLKVYQYSGIDCTDETIYECYTNDSSLSGGSAIYHSDITEWIQSKDTHYCICNKCKQKINEAPHRFTDGICDVCEYSIKAGENITWSYENGTLTFSGYGSMNYYSASDAVPWYEYYDSINKIVVGNGIDYIGDYSFWSCKDSTIIVIPDSVKVFDNFAVPTDAIIYCNTGSVAHSYAISNNIAFCLIDVISTIKGSNIGVSSSQQVIYGFTNGINSLADGISVPNGYNLSYDTSVGRVFTGMKITLGDESGALAEYSAVIFGDVNGDSWYDGQDAMLVNCIVNGMLTREQVGEAVWTAADCNHDGVIDELDVALLNEAGLLLSQVDQRKSEENLQTDLVYQRYLNLIDQTIETETSEVVEKAPIEEPIKTEANFFDIMIDIFARIIDYIKQYFTILN